MRRRKEGESMPEQFKYEIGGKKYIQRALVWGQIRQLKSIFQDIAIPATFQPSMIMGLLNDDNILKSVAVVLIPDGVNPKDKDLEALASELEFGLTPEIVMQVVEDFFDCNPIVSLSEKLGGMLKNLKEKILSQTKTPSSPPVSSSPEGTSPNGTESSGDTLQ
jgi:hypothetical protein